MIFRNYNDFEIVNQIKQGDSDAFEFMVDKYQYLIAKNIKKFNLTPQYEDVFQECLMILYKSIMRYDVSYQKSFTRFFEGNMKNRLITLKQKNNSYGKFLAEKLPTLCDFTIKESARYYISESEIKDALNTLSSFEKTVFQMKIIEKRTVRETANQLNCPEKKIYNALDRIKNKIKIQLM